MEFSYDIHVIAFKLILQSVMDIRLTNASNTSIYNIKLHETDLWNYIIHE